jgi:hypothetical protein
MGQQHAAGKEAVPGSDQGFGGVSAALPSGGSRLATMGDRPLGAVPRSGAIGAVGDCRSTASTVGDGKRGTRCWIGRERLRNRLRHASWGPSLGVARPPRPPLGPIR